MKLKTLRDLGFIRKDVNIRVIHEPELKAEAIKWVKEVSKHFGKDSLNDDDEFIHEDLKLIHYDCEQDDYRPVVKFVKHFFNITEEDLSQFDTEAKE